jgi:AraC-like DNA-binding protein
LYGLPAGEQAPTIQAAPRPIPPGPGFSEDFAGPSDPVHAEALEAIFSDRENPASAEAEKAVPEARPVNEKIIAQYLPVIEAYIQRTQPYLQAKMSIQDMAVATRIPLHHLSYIINQHYKVRYTDLMNKYRVDHAKSLIARGAWKELSLEGLGKQSGFANRTNFFLVFKKSTGLSPSEYLQGVKTGTVAPGNG